MTRFLRFSIILFLFATVGMTSLSAQTNDRQAAHKERAKVMAELRNYKHEFLAKELGLTKEQQKEFFPIYDSMDDAVGKINGDTRELERKLEKDENATDLELETAAKAIFEQKAKEGAIENEYFDQLKAVLTPRQLFNLKNAERKFTQYLLKHHRRLSRKATR